MKKTLILTLLTAATALCAVAAEQTAPPPKGKAKSSAEGKTKKSSKSKKSADGKSKKSAEGKTKDTAAEDGYVIVISNATATQPEWTNVVKALIKKHPEAKSCVLPALNEVNLTKVLQKNQARYLAVVARPEEVGRVLVNDIHRAARKVDDDPWGDCMWGIITGHTAADALRIAKASKPLTIKRALGSTNLDASRFEHSCCITDWTGFPVLEQSGYTEPTQTTYTNETEEGRDIQQNGIQGIFAKQLATQKPQLIVTSSHATQFNLEMPFSMGLIFPAENRYYELPRPLMNKFVSGHLMPALHGQQEKLMQLVKEEKLKSIDPDGETRVWLAAGNCLFGDAHNSDQSMAVTALSAYTCNQVVGYTVPSWYGKSGWGTMGTFFGNAKNTSLAEAHFLNNQFILHETMQLDPKLMNVSYNDEDFLPNKMVMDLSRAGVQVTEGNAKDCMGLVHDRDVLAFYGDPTWRAMLDTEHGNVPGFSVTWEGDTTFTITADKAAKSRVGIWFPKRINGASCDRSDAVVTNDFILFPELDMQQGETLKINLSGK